MSREIIKSFSVLGTMILHVLIKWAKIMPRMGPMRQIAILAFSKVKNVLPRGNAESAKLRSRNETIQRVDKRREVG